MSHHSLLFIGSLQHLCPFVSAERRYDLKFFVVLWFLLLDLSYMWFHIHSRKCFSCPLSLAGKLFDKSLFLLSCLLDILLQPLDCLLEFSLFLLRLCMAFLHVLNLLLQRLVESLSRGFFFNKDLTFFFQSNEFVLDLVHTVKRNFSYSLDFFICLFKAVSFRFECLDFISSFV